MIESLLTAAGLGAAAGMNAWATFVVFGLMARLMPGTFEGELANFFASTPVLIAMGVMYTIEFVADKIPAVDHAWDVVHTFVRPLAGAVVALAALAPDTPRWAIVLAVALGGGAALGGHLVKATTRGLSTVTTGGVANPFLSLAEDVLAIGQSLVAILVPWLILVVAVVGLVFYVGVRRKRRAIGTD